MKLFVTTTVELLPGVRNRVGISYTAGGILRNNSRSMGILVCRQESRNLQKYIGISKKSTGIQESTRGISRNTKGIHRIILNNLLVINKITKYINQNKLMLIIKIYYYYY